VQAVTAEWKVVPTTIQDQYNVKLELKYEADATIPELAVVPTSLNFTSDPARPSGPMLLNGTSATARQLRLYNPSRIEVQNVVVDASAVQGADVVFTGGGARSKQVTIGTIAPLSSVLVPYEASAVCPPARLDSKVKVTGAYTYFKATPTLSLSENSFTFSTGVGLAASKTLTLSNTGYNVATGVAVSQPTRSWVKVTRNLGDLGISNGAPFRVIVEPPAGTAAGTYTEDLLVTAGNDTVSAEHVHDKVASGRRLGPLFFFQIAPNSVVGQLTARWGLGGPVVCISPAGDPWADGTAEAELLLDDGDAEEVLLILAEQADPAVPDSVDHATALLLSLERTP
jgi:hypothetical protein